ncbi:response regulator [Cohnella sp. CBP 2801]|uniref:Response regulator n=2 Tax=Cohnella zeiphila TaxID=2761120 RepID=A0A7X0VYQ8_9BACL|nr:response regulator [Cohnella zeiphila]
MKVILLDDEYLALTALEHHLVQIPGITVAGKFVDPLKAKEYVLHHDIDAVFLDIRLPGMNGMEWTKQILRIKPRLLVVFVTAYAGYAVQAFELNAVDYLLKPVPSDRLLKTVQRLRKRAGVPVSREPAAAAAKPVQVRLFHQVAIEAGDSAVAPIRWRTARVQELFLYLLQHRGQLVRKPALADLIWPEYEPRKAYSQLYTAVYHIRKTLEPFGSHFQIASAAEGYILHLKDVRLDVEEWERGIRNGPPMTAETIDQYEKLMSLHAGDYLRGFEYEWAESERQRLLKLWIRTGMEMAECYLAGGRPEKAIAKYLEICNRHPQEEEAHFALMKLYAAANDRSSVIRQYRLLSEALWELNEKPGSSITEWYTNWGREI